MLSSVTPSAPLDIVVVYRDIDLSDMPHCWQCDSALVRRRYTIWRKPRDRAAHFRHQFGVFREMHGVRDFRLVLCVDVFDCMMEGGVKILERVGQAEGAVGGFGHLQKPLIISERRILRTCYLDQKAGWSGGGLCASAL